MFLRSNCWNKFRISCKIIKKFYHGKKDFNKKFGSCHSGSSVNSNDFEGLDVPFQLDQKRIQECEKRLQEAKEKFSSKLYAIKFEKSEHIQIFYNYMLEEAEWKEREAVGIIEINKLITKLKKEKIKENTLFIEATPLDAIYYFLSKKTGKGLKEAENFVSVLRPFGIALEISKQDAQSIANLEKELAAAQQGIDIV